MKNLLEEFYDGLENYAVSHNDNLKMMEMGLLKRDHIYNNLPKSTYAWQKIIESYKTPDERLSLTKSLCFAPNSDNIISEIDPELYEEVLSMREQVIKDNSFCENEQIEFYIRAVKLGCIPLEGAIIHIYRMFLEK